MATLALGHSADGSGLKAPARCSRIPATSRRGPSAPDNCHLLTEYIANCILRCYSTCRHRWPCFGAGGTRTKPPTFTKLRTISGREFATRQKSYSSAILDRQSLTGCEQWVAQQRSHPASTLSPSEATRCWLASSDGCAGSGEGRPSLPWVDE